jgi:hypothetical protein
MSTSSVDTLELRALEERNRLHRTAEELKTKVAITREKFDMKRNARQHFLGASIVVSALAFLWGYGLGGILTDR